MIEYGKETVEQKFPIKVTCDVCKTEYDWVKDRMEVQEFQHIHIEGGFGSVFGDGNKLRADICQYCFKKIFGKYLVEDNGGQDEVLHL